MSIKIICILLLCVYTSAHRNVRIMRGTEAKLGQFPSIVPLNVNIGPSTILFCGASIIDKQWILTAAHCVIGLPYFTVIGSLSSTEGTTYNVSTIIVHENWTYAPPYFDDIALFKLDREIVLSDTVKIAEIGESVGNDSCAVVGWGSTEETATSDTLLYANLTALTEDDCARLAEGSIFNLERGPGQVCAFGGNETAPGSGDYGGPLICDDKLVGVVSYNMGSILGYPDVYTRAAYYEDWIKNTISNN